MRNLIKISLVRIPASGTVAFLHKQTVFTQLTPLNFMSGGRLCFTKNGKVIDELELECQARTNRCTFKKIAEKPFSCHGFEFKRDDDYECLIISAQKVDLDIVITLGFNDGLKVFTDFEAVIANNQYYFH